MEQAIKWWTAAAVENEEAKINLGLSYLRGQGVSRDLSQALVWFGKAAALGNEHAKQLIAHILQLQAMVAGHGAA